MLLNCSKRKKNTIKFAWLTIPVNNLYILHHYRNKNVKHSDFIWKHVEKDN